MKNRIHSAINRYGKALVGEDSSKLRDLSKKLDMTVEEHFRSHNIKSLAQTSNWISLEEAATVHNILGSSVGHYNAQSLAAKVAVSALLRELIAKSKQKV